MSDEENIHVVIYAGTQIMSHGTKGDCLSFVDGGKELYPYIKDWKVMTLEEYGELMFEAGYQSLRETL